ncbi:major facilitator superfamily domain-containing protein [Paraphysoderma sedebokerense]|nr:major facilitator superfamily domain-containing protein [Paraphysoderma sedebokerense]
MNDAIQQQPLQNDISQPLVENVERPCISPHSAAQLKKWQSITLVLLILGYTAYFFSRSPLNTITPSILDEGFTKQQFGVILSFGYVGGAIGYVVNGFFVDLLGAKMMFLIGLTGCCACSILFVLIGDIHWMSFWWFFSRFFQAAGWNCLLKTVSYWFPVETHGRIIAICSVSWGLGDAVIRAFVGALLAWKLSWQSTMVVSAVVGLAMVPVMSIWLKERPSDLQLSLSSQGEMNGECRNDKADCHEVNIDKPLNQRKYFKRRSDESFNTITPSTSLIVEYPLEKPADQITLADYPPTGDRRVPSSKSFKYFLQRYRPLYTNPKFYLLLALAPNTTFIRETFSDWLAVYLVEVFSLQESTAAVATLAFPAFGTISMLYGGFHFDRTSPPRRALLASFYLVLTLCFLVPLTLLTPSLKLSLYGGFVTAITLVSIVSLFLYAPASFVDGAFALSVGGKDMSGLTVGMVDMMACVGGIFAGNIAGKLVENGDDGNGGQKENIHGWQFMLGILSMANAVGIFLMLVYWRFDSKEYAKKSGYTALDEDQNDE